MKNTSIKKNSVFNLIKTALTLAFPLITFPYISRVLLTDNLGRVNFGLSIVSYISLIASLGITAYATREASKYKDDIKKMEYIGSQIYSINILTTIAAYVVLAFILLFATRLYDYRILIVIQSTTVLFTTLGAEWVNIVFEDFKYITIRSFVFQILSLVLMFAFVHGPSDYLKYAAISVLSSSGANITNIIYRRRYCRLRFTSDIDPYIHLKPILFLFAMTLSQQIYVNSDITILGLFHGDNEVGLYSVAVKVYTMVNMMVASVSSVVIPGVSFNHNKGNYDEANRLLRFGLSYIIVFGLPIIIGLLMIPSDLIYVISGDSYTSAGTSLRILAISLAASYLSGFFSNMVLIPTGREKVCIMVSCVSAAINLMLNLILIPHFGKEAAAATTAIAEIIGLILVSRSIENWVEIRNIKEVVMQSGISALFMAVWIVTGKAVLQHVNRMAQVVVIVMVSAIIYGVGLIVSRNELAVSALRYLKRIRR